MEKELSNSVELGIMLVAVSVLLSIIFFTVSIGNGIKADAGDGLQDIKNDISINYITALANGEIDNDMPTATAYNILTTYSSVITESINGSTSKVVNLQRGRSDLYDMLGGRVQLELLELTPNGGQYVALIHTGSPTGIAKGISDCNWNDLDVNGKGSCTCDAESDLQKFKTDYKLKITYN